jgi:heat shock protein HtpX
MMALAPSPRHRVRNLVQELLLLTGLAVLLGAVGWLLAGWTGLLWVLLLVVMVGALRPRVPTAWVLSMYQAQPLPRWVAPRLHEIVDVLAVRAGLHRRPAVFYIASPLANAFVIGRQDDAALAVTDGLLRLLSARELVGVLAHEVSHLHNGDTSIMSLSDLVARLAQWMGWVGLWSVFVTFPLAIGRGTVMPLMFSLLLVVVPPVVTLMQLAVCRSREYDADLEAVTLTGDPEGLARALVMLEISDGRIWERILVGRSIGPDPLLLQTHPSTEERVRRLRALELGPNGQLPSQQNGLTVTYPPVTHSPRLRRTGIRW